MKKIDKNLPLPFNTKLDWLECFAKLIIENYSSLNVSNLVLKDKPDLQSEEFDVGIEVTSAVDKKSQEMDNLYSLLEYKQVKSKEKVLKRIEELGGKIDSGILIHPCRYRDLNRLFESLENKLKKINKDQYTIFNINSLIIFDDNTIREEEYNDILCKMIKISNKYAIHFNYVFIYIFGSQFIEFDLKEEKIFSIVPKNIYELSITARDMVVCEEEKD